MAQLNWIIGISTLLFLVYEGQKLHEATVCRQEAWRAGTVLATQRLFSEAPPRDRIVNLRCRLLVEREGERISWRGRSLQTHRFEISLRGNL